MKVATCPSKRRMAPETTNAAKNILSLIRNRVSDYPTIDNDVVVGHQFRGVFGAEAQLMGHDVDVELIARMVFAAGRTFGSPSVAVE